MIVSLSHALPIERYSRLSSATRDPAIGQGNGMAGSYEIVRLNGGTYQIWTGDVVYELNKGKRRPGFQSMPPVFGTGVMFSLDTSKPVDLASTWIASNSGVESGLIQSLSQASLPGLRAWVEVGGIAPFPCLKALLPQSISI